MNGIQEAHTYLIYSKHQFSCDVIKGLAFNVVIRDVE